MMKRYATVLWLVMLIAMVLLTVPALASESEAPPVCTHAVESWTVTEDGHSGLCSLCGETVADIHTYDDGVETTPPTCQESGVMTFTCVCSHSYEVPIPQLTDHVCESWSPAEDQHSGTCIHCGQTIMRGHTYDAGVETTPPTCTSEGVTTFTCTGCGSTTETPIEPLPHTYDDGVETSPPTCQESGVMTFTCICGHSYDEPIPQLTDHVGGNWTFDDTQHSGTCIHCGEAITGSHSYDSGVETTPPTCQESGVMTFTCVCGHSYEEPIPQLTDHVYGEYTADDTQHHQQCLYCDHILSADHSWDDGIVTTDPTCTEDGIKTFTCGDCGHSYQESVAALGHTYGDWVSTGETHHQHSCDCGDIVEEKHNWDSGEITTPSTCDKKGVKTFTCTDCGRTKTSQVATLPHTYDHACDISCNICGHIRRTEHQYETQWSTDEHNHWHECKVCGNDGGLQAHVPSQWIIDIPVGEYEDGQQHRDCTVCGLLLVTETIPATGCLHGNEELRGSIEPTCTQEGHTGNWVCPHCEAVLVYGEAIPMLPHRPQLENHQVPTCTQEGYTGDYICTDCGTTVASGKPIDKLPHVTQIYGQVPETCISQGYTGDHICQNCDGIIEPGSPIPASGHRYEEGICLDCDGRDPNYVPPTTPPSIPEPVPDDPTEKPTLSPMILGCIVALALAFMGMIVMIILLVRKK